MEEVEDWEALRLLRCVAERGSLRGAALVSGVSQPTLGRRIAALEASLGARLLVRHARGVSLTPDGVAAVEVARSVAERVAGLRRGVDGRRQDVVGRVRIACTPPVAAHGLPPVLRALREAYPALRVDVAVSVMSADLDRRDADLAIRMFAPKGAQLVARRVGQTFTAFYGSPEYVARRGAPASFAELASHDVIGPDREPLFVRQVEALGFSVDQLAHRTDDLLAVEAMVRAGLGLGALLGAVAERDPGLVRVMPPLIEHPVWLVCPPDLFASAPVRAVWDALAERLSAWLS